MRFDRYLAGLAEIINKLIDFETFCGFLIVLIELLVKAESNLFISPFPK